MFFFIKIFLSFFYGYYILVYMNILIVYAHPHHNSLNGAIFESIIQNINSRHSVKVIDLYEEQFNPILYFDEDNKRRNLQFNTETQAYRDLISWSDHIMFVYPIWWSGMPAILKGFIDRVFVLNFAYSYTSSSFIPNKLLKGKTASILVTHDTPKIISKFIQKDYGKILKTQILKNMCGIKVEKMMSLTNVRNSSQRQRNLFLKKVALYSQSL
jgi:Putative NADPH-quinone reductase (modulator of drug activity B)